MSRHGTVQREKVAAVVNAREGSSPGFLPGGAARGSLFYRCDGSGRESAARPRRKPRPCRQNSTPPY